MPRQKTLWRKRALLATVLDALTTNVARTRCCSNAKTAGPVDTTDNELAETAMLAHLWLGSTSRHWRIASQMSQ